MPGGNSKAIFSTLFILWTARPEEIMVLKRNYKTLGSFSSFRYHSMEYIFFYIYNPRTSFSRSGTKRHIHTFFYSVCKFFIYVFMLFYMTIDHMPFTEQYGKLSSTKTKSSMQQKSAQKGPKKKRLGLRKTILKVFLNSFMEFFSRPDYPINNQLFQFGLQIDLGDF